MLDSFSEDVAKADPEFEKCVKLVLEREKNDNPLSEKKQNKIKERTKVWAWYRQYCGICRWWET